MPESMTDAEVKKVLAFRKRIAERLKWTRRKDDRPDGRELRAAVVPYQNSDYERTITLVAESYRSRSGLYVWSVGLRLDGMRPLLFRIDTHDKTHVNPDDSVIEGCMMHIWSEKHGDTFAVSALDLVDCSNVDAALMDFLNYCNIELTEPYQMRMGGYSHGGM